MFKIDLLFQFSRKTEKAGRGTQEEAALGFKMEVI